MSTTLDRIAHSSSSAPSTLPASAERMSIVVAGHVDHGKSTVIGRLLADTGALPDGKLAQVRAHCARHAKPFEYAFLLDALKDEQAQGITIDAARIFFRTARRHYIVIDAPGHVEFLKNMVTGASRAEAALLVIDAHEGVRENSRRHGYLTALLGVRQVAVVVNKMDLVGRQQRVFDRIVAAYGAFLAELDVRPTAFIPVVAREGENLAGRSPMMPWYHGPTVLDALDEFTAEPPPVGRPFRMPVQGVYKFTELGDDRRIVAGTVDTGTLRPGDEIVFHPSGKRSRVRAIEAFHSTPPAIARAGQAIGFTLDEQVYIARGEITVRAGEPGPAVARRLAVSLFWLGREPLRPGRDYLLKLGTARVPARLESVTRVIDAADLRPRTDAERVERHEVADCVLRLRRPIAVDAVADQPGTSRFVLVDDYDIRGGGIVRDALPDEHTPAPLTEPVQAPQAQECAASTAIVETHTRSVAKAISWRLWGTVATAGLVYLFTGRFVLSLAVGGLEFLGKIGLFWLHERLWTRISIGARPVEPAVVWLTGLSGAGKSTIAAQVVVALRRRGLRVEHLDGDAVRAVFPATGFTREERDAHVQRMGFLASRLERHGVFVVASFVSPYAESRAFVRGLCRRFIEVHVDTPLEECERRDTKGLYARARRGELQQFTGLDDPYESPPGPELRIDTRDRTADECARLILDRIHDNPLHRRRWYGPARSAREPQYSYSA